MSAAIPLDGPIRALFDEVARHGSIASPDLGAIGAALSELAADHDYLARWVDRLGDADGALPIHAPGRGPRLMIVHRSTGNMSAVHDHGTWVAISPVVGVETHRRWRVIGDAADRRLDLAENLALGPSATATLLPPDDLHDHGHIVGRGNPAHVLILLGDDQTRFTRNEWDLASGRHRILSPGVPGRWVASEPMPSD